MDSILIFQLGSTITTLQSQVQQLTQMLTHESQQHQETRSLLEALATSQGLEYSQDMKAWVKTSAIRALRDSMR